MSKTKRTSLGKERIEVHLLPGIASKLRAIASLQKLKLKPFCELVLENIAKGSRSK